MNLRLLRQLQGPSPFAHGAAALIALEWDEQVAQRLVAACSRDEAAQWWARVAAVGLHACVSPAAGSWLDVVTQVADGLRQPYCIDQGAVARVHEQTRHRVVWVVPCDDPQVGLQAMALALAMVQEWLSAPGTTDDRRGHVEAWMKRRLAQLLGWQRWADAQALNVNARWIVREAVCRGIPWYRQPGSGRLVQLGQGAKARRLDGAVTDAVNSVAFEWSQDKWQTARFLAQHGLPTAAPQPVTSLEEALRLARERGWPVVLKPRAANKGVGVTANVRSPDELEQAWAQAVRYRGGVLLERYIEGDDHRLLVVGGRCVAAARRRAAEVVGDGRKTLAELVEQLNQDRRSGAATGVYLPVVEVVLDEEAQRMLVQQGMTADSIVLPGQVVRLRGHANLSTGGSSVDVTEHVHPDNRALAERAARLLGLSMAGVDFQTTDISRSWRQGGGALLELNAGPGLLPHLPATAHHNVLRAIVDDLFPAPGDGRIPTAGITGSVGKTTTCRMLAAILRQAGHTVALATTQGTAIDDHVVLEGDCAAGRYAVPLLHDASVTAAVVEMARGGLIKQGMGLDAVDVGAVLNVHDNHLGLDGVQTREALASVKQLVVRHARKLAVLNADDPLCLRMMEGLEPARVCLVSELMQGRLQAHLEAGGLAAVVIRRQDEVVLRLLRGQQLLGEMAADEIAATWRGTFRPAVLNALFALALAQGLGVPFETSRAALQQFESDYATNPGRMNHLKGLPFEMLLTYADGPQALGELARFVVQPRWPAQRTLVFYAGGNRPDSFIVDSARAVAGAFERYYCTDMEEDRRGRAPGEVAGLLAHGLRASGVPETAIVVEPSSRKAVEQALSQMQDGAMLVVESYHHAHVMAALKRRFADWDWV